jgi:hypothetical protein
MDLMLWYEDLCVQFALCRVRLVGAGFAYWASGQDGLVFTWVKSDKLS